MSFRSLLVTLMAGGLVLVAACDSSSDPEGLSPNIARGRIHQLGHTYSLEDYRGAIENSDIELFKLYLYSGLLIEQSVNGMSAPCIAAAARSRTILNYLKDKEPDLLSKQCDQYGRTPLMVAIQDGRDWLTIDWLLNEASDLDYLEVNGHYVLSFTLQQYTDYLSFTQKGELRNRILANLTATDQRLGNPKDFSLTSFAVNALLVSATLEKDFDALKFGLENGGDANQTNSFGQTLLQLAIDGGWHPGADYLLFSGANGAAASPDGIPLLVRIGRLIASNSEVEAAPVDGWLDLSAKIMVMFPEFLEDGEGNTAGSEFWHLVPGQYHGSIHLSVTKYSEIARKAAAEGHPQ